jgi:hypothetical protein
MHSYDRCSSTHTRPQHYKRVGGQHRSPASLPPGKDPGPIVQDVRWAWEPVWMDPENPASTRYSSLGVSSTSLYRLTVLAAMYVCTIQFPIQVQWEPLIVINLGLVLFDNNNRLITLSGGYKNLHYLTQFIVTIQSFTITIRGLNC